MPELPEVETIKRQLSNKIVGKKIKDIEIRLPRMIQGASEQKFRQIVIGTEIKGVQRRAKLLIINLSNNYSLVIHLKLSGQIIYRDEKGAQPEDDRHAHIIYTFSDHSRLIHKDMRQFGYVQLTKTNELENLFIEKKLGPEPLKKDFTLAKFQTILVAKPRQKIKPLLMDQSFLAGVGNIYAQEACFCAKILPARIVKSLSELEIKNLYYCLVDILNQAIASRGSSVDLYLDAEGKRGEYVPKLKVYDRGSEKCLRCSGIVKKMVLAGRGTYYCPKCQK